MNQFEDLTMEYILTNFTAQITKSPNQPNDSEIL